MPLTGYWINGICTATQADALNAVVAQYPQFSSGYIISVINQIFTAPNNIGMWVQSQNTLTGAYTGVWMDFMVSSCDPAISTEPFFDGMQMGWGVVSAMAAAAAVIYLKKALFR